MRAHTYKLAYSYIILMHAENFVNSRIRDPGLIMASQCLYLAVYVIHAHIKSKYIPKNHLIIVSFLDYNVFFAFEHQLEELALHGYRK